MAKALVDNPDQLEVTEIAGRDTSVIELKAAKEDMGKIIGKKGQNAQAMRTLKCCVEETQEACGS